MKRLLLASAIILAGVGTAAAQSPTNTVDPHFNGAQEGGRQGATPGYNMPPTSATPANPVPAKPGYPNSRNGGAVEGGRAEATPGYNDGVDMNPTGSIAPRPSTPDNPDAHTGGAIEGGRNDARP